MFAIERPTVRATSRSSACEELNIGQLCRQRFGDNAALIGFGTHTGTVAAATDWDGDMEVKHVRPPQRDSYERLFHDADCRASCSILTRIKRCVGVPKLGRFMGVINRPENELMRHY